MEENYKNHQFVLNDRVQNRLQQRKNHIHLVSG